MKLLTNLSATPTDGEYIEPRGSLTLLHDEPVSGFFRLASLGAAGIVFSRGKDQIAIPIAELWKLVEQHHAAFVPPVLATETQSSLSKNNIASASSDLSASAAKQ